MTIKKLDDAEEVFNNFKKIKIFIYFINYKKR